MIEQYNKARDLFFSEVKELFPNSDNIHIEIMIDNISIEDFNKIPLPHRNCSIAMLEFKEASPIVEDETKIDTFRSEFI